MILGNTTAADKGKSDLSVDEGGGEVAHIQIVSFICNEGFAVLLDQLKTENVKSLCSERMAVVKALQVANHGLVVALAKTN